MARSKGITACWGGIGMAVLAGLAASGAMDNTARAQVYGIALPDISNKTLILRPNTAAAGDAVEIVSAVQNKGSGDLMPRYRPRPPALQTAGGDGGEPMAPPPPTLLIRFVLVANVMDASGIPAGDWGVEALKQREIERHTTLWTIPPETAPGTYYLCADVDPDKKVRESNELNNRTCQRLTVKPPPEPGPEDMGSPAEDREEADAEDAGGETGFSGLDGEEAPQ